MTELTKPTFRNWRIHSYPTSNVAIIVPNRIGIKFSEEELVSLLAWLKENNLNTIKKSTTSIRVISSDMESLDLEDYGMAGVKMAKAIKKKERRLQEKQDRLDTESAAYNALPSSVWIDKEFQAAGINRYNKLRLAEFLDGKAGKFSGLISWKWAEVVIKLDALTSDGQEVDFDKLKRAYLFSQGHA